MLIREVFKGNPYQIGLQHGKAYRHMIALNTSVLVDRPNPNLPEKEDEVEADRWFIKQRRKHFNLWPWLEEEMAGISKGSGVPLADVEKLNFRIWQAKYYGKKNACSSFVVAAKEGGCITGGTLDDPRWLYAFCEVRSKNGFRYMSFPIAGTCWGNRGMNEKGLVVNISSNMIQGLKFNPDKMYQQDLAVRVILQTCKRVEEVQLFCEKYPFLLNLIVVDASGKSLTIGVWDQGPTVYSTSTSCLTDHPIEAQLKAALDRGYDESTCIPCSLTRLDHLCDWTRKVRGKATIEEAKRMLSCRKNFLTGGVNNPGTIFATLAQPEKNPKDLWIAETPIAVKRFKKYSF